MFRRGTFGPGRTSHSHRGLIFGNPGRHLSIFHNSLLSDAINYYIYGAGGVNNQESLKPNVTSPTTDGSSGTTPPKEEISSGNTLPRPDPNKILSVVGVDLQVSVNAKDHHTGDYEICKSKTTPMLVVRRGQPFTISVDFSKEYDAQQDDLRLVFEAGDSPAANKGTSVDFILSDDDKPKEWGAKIQSQKGNSLTITVFTPPTCLVGKWTLKLDVVKKENTSVNIYRYQHKDAIYILFNPWCKDDDVYLDNERLLGEYVLNEKGGIYSGSDRSISFKPWNFGQFESCVLDCAMYLLDICELNWSVRGNPVLVVRKLSALVNSSDDNGVLAGNWSSNYAGGRSPLSWTGSSAILEKYWKTKSPVKYGQCWVFSGLSTTLCRTLGIPARCVTNFESAHDSDGSVSVDYFKVMNTWKADCDSVWNFHVWNEAWLSRPDLPAGYGGWQAFDATPQETSDGVYCCGPASVRAIREGRIELPYDGPFIFAEVNADKVYWSQDNVGKLQCVDLNCNAIGKHISTKAVDSNEREDLSDHYKPKEGSQAERVVVRNAYSSGSKREISNLYKATSNDIEFKVNQDQEHTFVGDNFVLSLTMKNNGDKDRTVSGQVDVHSMYYTGVVADEVKRSPFNNLVIKPKQEVSQVITVTQEEYFKKLKDFCMLDVSVWALVQETNQHFIKKGDYRLRKPHLQIQSPKEAKVGEEIKVEVSFINPLNTSLTNCFIIVDGLAHSLKFRQSNVNPNSTFTNTVPISPTKEGKTEIILNFNSDELQDINVAHAITVRSV
ncbi:unnamed protein product [Lymnaea stagnalis]|uniref:protein-glutamine gamma-glutamyltransferase n=1 Tax=Lymnaea stagnalis TaxID=6523 RepID=A0AAV2HFK1_LYMST